MPLGRSSASSDLPTPVVVGCGAMIGTAIRWAMVTVLENDVTVALLVLNVTGALMIGWLAGRRLDRSHHWWLFLATGVLGGLTSFSSFAVDVAERLDGGNYDTAALTTLTTVILAVVAASAGYWLSSRRSPGANRRSPEAS